MRKTVRVGITLPAEVLRSLDGVVGMMKYESRSKAIQDAVNLFVSEKRCEDEAEGLQAGVLALLYDHEVEGLEGLLTHVQHRFASLICATMHIHLNEKDCLEAIGVKGSGAEIRRLSHEISSKKGVKMLRVTTIAL
jgi:CopG family nickel-responsive transcriptional regulator